jgi:hypothetical protein
VREGRESSKHVIATTIALHSKKLGAEKDLGSAPEKKSFIIEGITIMSKDT